MNQQAFVETQYEGCISIYWLIDSLSFLDVSSKFCLIIIAMHIGNSNANQDIMVCLLLKR